MQKGIYFILTILLAGLIGSAACHKAPKCTHHIFQQSVLVTPERAQVYTGDTIWVSAQFNCSSMMNAETGLPEDFCGMQDFTVQLNLRAIEPTTLWDAVWDYLSIPGNNFELIDASGISKNKGSGNIVITYQIDKNQYEYRIGIVPKEAGQFVIFFEQSRQIMLMDPENCDTGSFKFVSGNKDPHEEILQHYMDKYFPDDSGNYTKWPKYCFEVLKR